MKGTINIGANAPNSPRNLFSTREMIYLQQFYNIFKINPKWQIVTGCYC